MRPFRIASITDQLYVDEYTVVIGVLRYAHTNAEERRANFKARRRGHFSTRISTHNRPKNTIGGRLQAPGELMMHCEPIRWAAVRATEFGGEVQSSLAGKPHSVSSQR
jgi:hypothetical protein